MPWSVPNKQAACVVETVGNLDPIRVELIAELEELQCLLSPYCAGAQHGIDRHVVGP